VDAGLVPVKQLSAAKRRLEPALDSSARHELARALLLDALDLCRSTNHVRWYLVAADDEVAALSRRARLTVLQDRRHDLNLALSDAVEDVIREGARSATVLPADIPLARAEDVQDLLDTGDTSDVVVAPSRDGGTNALHLRPPGVLRPRFGPDSLRAHAAEAERLDLRCSILDLPRLALDIDTEADLAAFREAGGADTHTGAMLRAVPVRGSVGST
jgi:2-phospho-L-lactate guanylyltransferase